MAGQVAKVTAADDALANELDRLRPGADSSSTLRASVGLNNTQFESF